MYFHSPANERKIRLFQAVIVSQGSGRLGTSALRSSSLTVSLGNPCPFASRHPADLSRHIPPFSSVLPVAARPGKHVVSWTAGSHRHLRHAGGRSCYCPCLSAPTPKACSRMLARTSLPRRLQPSRTEKTSLQKGAGL